MNTPTRQHPTATVRFDALGAADANGLAISPASLLVEFAPRPGSIFPARVLAVGSPAEVNSHEASRSSNLKTIKRPRDVLIPGLVNAHTHLDLTHIGPQPHDPAAGFVPWVNMIRTRRETDGERIAASVRRGVDLSLGAGTVAVGDIAGAVRGQMTLEPWLALRQSPLIGVSWLEFFGIGKGLARSEEALDRFWPEMEAARTAPVRIGFQPHAPNTVARSLYSKAIALARHLPPGSITTHLAETPEERQFIAHASGAQRELLESLGLWDESIAADLGQGRTPIEHLRSILEGYPLTGAHVNDADEAGVRTLARTGTKVVYCPRASAYFGAERHFGPHRYREMLEAGVCVALGTDSIVNLPPESGWLPAENAGGKGMSMLDEMRFLRVRDGTDAGVLLRMGTTNGAMAIGVDPAAFAIRAGNPLAGLIGVAMCEQRCGEHDPEGLLERILDGKGVPQLLFANIFSDGVESRDR